MQLLYGLNKSGISIGRFLSKNKERFDCWDDDPKVRKKLPHG